MPSNDTQSNVAASVDASYLQAPAVTRRPGPEYRAGNRAFQGIPSLACGSEGRLYAVWYGGKTPGEDHNNYVILAVSQDGGRTWSDEILVIDPDGEGPVRAFDPEIWLAPDGQLWLFWAQGIKHVHPAMRNGVWAMTAREPEAHDPAAWSEPRRLCDGVMMCKPLVLTTGEWALPVSLWHRRDARSAAMMVSTDAGATWSERGACDVPPEARNHDEHMIVEREDGSLWMLVRTLYGIGESFSTDGGRTWSALSPTEIPHPVTRFFIRRLASGRLLLVRHDPHDAVVVEGRSKGTRSHLTAFLSEDDGRTWPYRLLLDERVKVSYPDGDQAGDGTVYVIYDFERTQAREILMAAFRESDLMRETEDASQGRLRVLINKATKP